MRQQTAVLKRKRRRSAWNCFDRLFWTTLRSLWPEWSDVLVVVKPETVVAWHRAGCRWYWRWRSRPRGGQSKVSHEIRRLIRMASENVDWVAPKIHGELLKLGFEVAERMVARYLQRMRPYRREPAHSWRVFLSKHREVIVAFDFFTVPTQTFRLLYCFFVIQHSRCRVLHFNITRHPTSAWLCNNCVRLSRSGSLSISSL
jgi:hypothetical protein